MELLMVKNRYVECIPDTQYSGLYIPKTVVADKRQGDFLYIETTCVTYAAGALKEKTVKRIGTMAIRYGIDKLGRIWELFIDPCHYDNPCFKMIDDKDVNSPNIFAFNMLNEAMEAMSKFMITPIEQAV